MRKLFVIPAHAGIHPLSSHPDPAVAGEGSTPRLPFCSFSEGGITLNLITT